MKPVLAFASMASAATMAVVGLLVAPASAHVTINTLGEVQQGAYAKLGFSVPNERDDAGTVKLEVQMPVDHPLTSVSVQPKPGWEVEMTTRKLDPPLVSSSGTSYDEVVDTITWTAASGTRIEPGQFELFWISAGRMPTDAESLEFPALQTYDSGEVVRWIEPTPPGGERPERPAPSVALVAAEEEAAAPAADAVAAVDVAAAPGPVSDEDDDGVSMLSVIALVVGGLGLVAGMASLVTARRRSV